MNDKNLSLFILIMAILAEYFHLLFVGEIHSYYLRNGARTVIYWDDMIYYFCNESFTLFVIVIIRIKAGASRASKAMLTGLIVWFTIEWIEITLQLLKLSDCRLYINDGSWVQLSTCLTIAYLEYYGKIKYLLSLGYSLAFQLLNIIMRGILQKENYGKLRKSKKEYMKSKKRF